METPSETSVATEPAPYGRTSPYAKLVNHADRGIIALAPPRLPAEVRGPRVSLRSVIHRCSARKRTRIALALAEELTSLHRDGTAVGRLTPDNVVFGMTGYPEIASIGEADLESVYAAPELFDRRTKQRRPHGTPRADTYALGALLYFIFTGKEPPATWTTRAFARLSPTTSALVARCVNPDPWRRPSARQVAEYIEQAGPSKLRSTGLSAPIDLVRRKPHTFWNVASVFVLTSVAALLVLAGTVTTAFGAVGVATMLLGASITVGASF